MERTLYFFFNKKIISGSVFFPLNWIMEKSDPADNLLNLLKTSGNRPGSHCREGGRWYRSLPSDSGQDQVGWPLWEAPQMSPAGDVLDGCPVAGYSINNTVTREMQRTFSAEGYRNSSCDQRFTTKLSCRFTQWHPRSLCPHCQNKLLDCLSPIVIYTFLSCLLSGKKVNVLS